MFYNVALEVFRALLGQGCGGERGALGNGDRGTVRSGGQGWVLFYTRGQAGSVMEPLKL
jgi:hypothetical protein